jgi:integrase
MYGFKKALKAGVQIPHWHPHQLRHSLATEIRKKYGIEAAQIALGHARADVTEVYAEKNMEIAKKIAREMG